MPPYATDPATLAAESIIDYYSGTGKGGQNRNRHYNCVRIRHLPSGIIVVATEHRSQHKNRELAMARLVKRLQELNYTAPQRIPTKIPRSKIKARLEHKARRAATKMGRRRIPRHDTNED